MANERDTEAEPKVTIVDRRMLTDDERAGKSELPATTPQSTTAAAPAAAAPAAAVPAAAAPPVAVGPADEMPDNSTSSDMDAFEDDLNREEEMSPEQLAGMRAEMEGEQFAAIEARLGRSLTETEKDSVRGEMDNQAREQARQMSTLEVAPMIQQFLAEISARAAIHMGLMPNPYTRLIAKNDAEARLSIDCFAAVYETLKPRLEPALQKEYSRVLNDLRVNFSQQTGLPAGSFGNGGFGSPGGPKIIH